MSSNCTHKEERRIKKKKSEFSKFILRELVPVYIFNGLRNVQAGEGRRQRFAPPPIPQTAVAVSDYEKFTEGSGR